MAVYVYNSGNSTQGKQVQDFFLTRTALRRLDQVFNFAKFATKKETFKQHSGEVFKANAYYWSIFRDVVDSNGNYTGVQGGYIAERDLKEIEDKLNSMQLNAEGVTDKSSIFQLGTFRKVTFQTSIKKYAGIVELTEDVETYSEDPVRALTIEDVTLQMNDAYNSLIMRDILSNNFRVYGGDATSRDELGGSDDTQSRKYTMTETLTVQVYNQLIKNKAKPMAEIIAGTNKIGTKPIPQAFYVIVGADLYGALINKDLFPEFTSVEEYADPSVRLQMEGLEEIGRLGRFRICYSETLGNYKAQGALVGGNGDNPSNYCHSEQGADGKYRYNVYPAIVMSRDAIATVGLQGKTQQQIYTRWPDVIDNGNPIGERGYVAFKFRYASIITRPEALAVMEVTCPIAN